MSLSAGIATALFSALGTIIGGWAMTRTRTSITKLMFYASIILGLLFLVSIVQMFLSCPQIPMAGAAVGGQWTFNASCNAPCACPSDQFEPVCGADGLSYLSACSAGCANQMGRNVSSERAFRGRRLRCWK